MDPRRWLHGRLLESIYTQGIQLGCMPCVFAAWEGSWEGSRRAPSRRSESVHMLISSADVALVPQTAAHKTTLHARVRRSRRGCCRTACRIAPPKACLAGFSGPHREPRPWVARERPRPSAPTHASEYYTVDASAADGVALACLAFRWGASFRYTPRALSTHPASENPCDK
eukprot:COSAG06_NODE_192_length_20674_cov_7.209186_3_plen_171_part_00